MRKKKFDCKKIKNDNTLPGTNIKAITPDTDYTKLPYQGVMSFNNFYNTLCNQCFANDLVAENIVKRKFTGAAVASMPTELALDVYEVLEKAKIAKTKVFLELMSKVANDAYWNRQLELQRELLSRHTGESETEKKKETIEEVSPLFSNVDKKKIIKLLQQSVQEDIIEGKIVD